MQKCCPRRELRKEVLSSIFLKPAEYDWIARNFNILKGYISWKNHYLNKWVEPITKRTIIKTWGALSSEVPLKFQPVEKVTIPLFRGDCGQLYCTCPPAADNAHIYRLRSIFWCICHQKNTSISPADVNSYGKEQHAKIRYAFRSIDIFTFWRDSLQWID